MTAMLPRDPNFTRIPVTARGMGGTATYWLGPDHLLIVQVHGSQERYQRYYYRDIQTLALRANQWGRAGNAILALLLLPCLVMALVLGMESLKAPKDDGFVFLVWAIPAVGLLISLVANVCLGRPCSCQLRTAVQAEELPGLHRLRPARTVLAQLRERVLQTQGALSPADLGEAARTALGAAPPAAPPTRAAAAPSLHNAGYLGRYHAILCWLLLVLAGLCLSDLFWQSDAVDGTSLAALLSALVINVLALVRQNGSRLPDRLRGLTWGVLAFHLVLLGIAIGYAIFVSIKHPELAEVHERPWDNPLLLGLDFASIFIGGLAGLAGLLMLARFRREALTPPPLVPANPPHLDTVSGAPASGPAGGELLPPRPGAELGAPPLPPALPPPPPPVS